MSLYPRHPKLEAVLGALADLGETPSQAAMVVLVVVMACVGIALLGGQR